VHREGRTKSDSHRQTDGYERIVTGGVE